MNVRVSNLIEDAFALFCEGPPTAEKCDAFLAMVTEKVAAWKATPPEDRPCCQFRNVDHVVYKGVYLPGRAEFGAHGYDVALYDSFMESWKKNIDEHGRP